MSHRWVPNILTIINLSAGLLSMLLAFAEHWALAVALIFGAALFDSIDGRIARRLNVVNEFGKQLDLLADLVSFGIAPAFVAYGLVLADSGWSGYLLAVIFPVCGAVRLASFNYSGIKGHYRGLPLALAGPLLAACAYFGVFLPVAVQSLLLLVLAVLMVLPVKLSNLSL